MDAVPEWGSERGAVGPDPVAMVDPVADAVAGSFLWQRFSTVCEVQGGDGADLALLLCRQTYLWGAVVDVPALALAARRRFHATGVGVRANFIAGDPFVDLPAGFDAYLLRQGLGAYSGPLIGRLLGRIRAAIAPRSRLVLVERLPQPDQAGLLRSRAEAERILNAAGFEIERGIPLAGCAAGTCLLVAGPVRTNGCAT